MNARLRGHATNASWQVFQGLLIWGMTIGVATAATAPRYRLVNGKGTTVCEAFLKNLNAFPEKGPPMACEVKVHPSHPEFSLPKWEPMDIQSNLKIIYAAEKQMPILNAHAETRSLSFEQWEKAFQERIKTGKAKPVLRKTVLALNSRGPETLIAYRVVDQQCQSDFQKYNNAIAPEDSVFVLRAGSEPLVEAIIPDQVSIVLFKQRPYFFTAGYGGGNRWDIRLKYVSPKLPQESGSTQYIGLFRCEFHVSMKSAPGK